MDVSGALRIYKEILGENHPYYATSLNNLAGLYFATGNYEKAEQMFHEALRIRKEIWGENHPDYAASLNNLAGLYEEIGS
ncbi:MAG: tetratricopeptide repeat protein [Ignavibacteria bacterium]|nr:tetratricopeptide repeat protein [Ignavibacteria bacterium]